MKKKLNKNKSVQETDKRKFLPSLENEEKKQLTEESLRISQERYYDLFEYNPNPMLIYEMGTWRFVDINKTALALYGYLKEEFLLLSVLDIIPQEDVLPTLEILNNSSEIRNAGIKRHIKKNGSIIFVDIKSNLLPKANGKNYRILTAIDVTEKILADQKLNQEYEFVNTLLETIPNPVYFKNRDEVVTRCNESFANFLGIGKEGIIGKTIYELQPKEFAEKYYNMDLLLYSNPPKQQYQSKIMDKAGNIHEVIFSKAIVNNLDGEVQGIVGIISDITEFNQSKNLLRESEERYRTFFENSTVGIYRTTPEGEIISVNNALIKMLGYSSLDEIIKIDLNESSYSKQGFRNEFMEKIDKEEKVLGFESQWKKKNGEPVYVRENARAFKDSLGKVLYYEGIVEDITDVKNAEHLLKSELNFVNTLIKTIPNPIFYKNRDGIYTGCNKALEILLEVDSENFIGKTVFDIYPEELAVQYNKMDEFLYANPPYQSYESELKTKWGKTIQVIFNKAIIYNHDGSIEGLIAVLSDITERKKADLSLKESEEKYRLLFEQLPIGVFNYDLSLKIINCNQEFVNILHSKFDFLIDLDMNHLLDKRIFPAIQNSIKSKKDYYEGFYKATFSDVEIFISLIAVPVFNTDGKIKGGMGIVQDITKRKQAEESIRLNEERMRVIVEGTPYLFFYIQDTKANLTYISPTVKEITGYSVEEWFANRNWFTTDSVLNKRASSETWQHLKGEYTNEEILLEIKHAKGHKIILSVYENPIINDGKVIGVQGVALDITSRKQMEFELEKSKKRYEDLINVTPYAIYVHQNSIVVFCNPAFLKLFGYNKREEIIGRPLYNFIHPNFVEIIKKRAKDTYSENAEIKNPIEVSYIKSDGTTFIGEGYASLLTFDEAPSIQVIINDITEKKNAEKELQKLSQAVEQSPASIIITNPNGEIEYVNPKLLISSGYSIEELKGENPKIFKSGDKLKDEYKNLWDTILSGSQWKGEFRNKRKDGSYYWESATISPIKNKEGKIINFIAIKEDITEKKLILDALKEREEYFRLFYENSPVGYISIDAKSNINEVNKALLDQVGRSKEEVVNHSVIEFLSETSILRFKSNFAEFIQNGKISNIEYEIIHKNGTIIIFSIDGRIIKNSKGEFNQAYIVMFNITERKIAEEEIIRNQKFIERITEQSPDIIYIYDVYQERNIYTNKDIGKSLGYEENELPLNDKDFFNILIHPDDLKQFDLYYDKVKQWDKEYVSWFEYRIKAKNGDWRWFAGKEKEFQRNENGQVISILGTVMDITERKNAEEEIIKAKEKAEEMSKLKSNFLANMSHELRTPLVGMLGFSELLQNALENEYKEYANVINKSGNRLLKTLNDILNFSKIEAEKIEVVEKVVLIDEIIKDEVNLFTPSAQKKDLYIKYKLPQSKISALTDQTLLIEILDNLINNAIKFTKEGGINVSLEVLEEEFIIKVSDSGIGIPDNKIDYIFEEFRQASEGISRNFEGTGLGLTIVKRYVECLNGKISVESKEGVGTSFTIVLPWKYPLNNELHASKQELNIYTETDVKIENKEHYKVLMVDDDDISIKLVNRIIGHQYELTSVNSASEAVELTQNKQYDIILMDINLKTGISGIEATKEIRKLKAYEKTPIVALTAYAMGNEKIEFIKHGCSHYLSKPFTKKQLLDLLTDIVEKFI